MNKYFKVMISIINVIRREYFTSLNKWKLKSCGTELRVNRKSNLGCNTYLGDNCNFNGMDITGIGKVTIGNNFHSGKECLMITSNHNYDSGLKVPYDETIINKKITINDNVWIGTRVIILGGVELGEGCIIQAGSVVVKDIPPYAIAGGNPAEVFKYRDIEHYERLKSEKKFY